jgi:hypothetical protein
MAISNQIKIFHFWTVISGFTIGQAIAATTNAAGKVHFATSGQVVVRLRVARGFVSRRGAAILPPRRIRVLSSFDAIAFLKLPVVPPRIFFRVS